MIKKILLGIGLPTLLMAKTYTLEQCISVAMESNTDIKKVKEEQLEAKSMVSEAWGSALPTINLQGKYEAVFEQYSPMSGDMSSAFQNSGPFLDPNAPTYNAPTAALAGDFGNLMKGLGDAMASDYTASLGLVLTQIIFAQGKVSTGLEIAKENDQQLIQKLSQTKQSVIKDVKNSYAQILYAKEAVNVYKAGIEQAQKHLALVTVMFQEGLVSELDHLRAQSQVEELSAGLEKAEKDVELAGNALMNIMGLEYSKELEFEGKLVKPEITIDRNNAFNEAKTNRPEIKQLDHYKKIREHLVTIEKADNLPMLVGGGSLMRVGIGQEVTDYNWAWDARAFLQMEWNIFRGGQTKEKIVQAKTQVRQVDLTLLKLERGIRLQLESALNTLDELEKRLPVRERIVALNKKSMEIAETSYKVGKLTQLEFLDTELKLRQAQLNLLETLFEYNQAVNELNQVMGRE